MDNIRRRSDGSINLEFYARCAQEERRQYLRQTFSQWPVGYIPVASRSLKLIGAGFLVATGAFWATMLTHPPQTEASSSSVSSKPTQKAELFSIAINKLGAEVPTGPGYDAH